MRGQGYDAEHKVSTAPLTMAQRQRLESFTAVIKLKVGWDRHDAVAAANFIATGETNG